MLKFTIESLEEAAKGTEGFYSETEDGKFVLQVEGGPQDLSTDVDKLKTSLSAAREDTKQLKQKFSWVGDLTETEVRELKDAKEDLSFQLENNKAPSSEEIEERAERLAARKTRDLENQVKSTSEELESYRNAVSIHEAAAGQRRIRDAVDEALSGGSKIKVHDSAREDIYPYAERIMTVTEDGKVVSKEGNGVDPELTFDQVLSDIQTSGRRAHWFQGNTSGGLDNNGKPSGYTGINPFADDTKNWTEIGNLKRTDPRKAEQLCIAAGKDPVKMGLKPAA